MLQVVMFLYMTPCGSEGQKFESSQPRKRESRRTPFFVPFHEKKYTLSCEPIKVHARKRFGVNLDLTESGAGD